MIVRFSPFFAFIILGIPVIIGIIASILPAIGIDIARNQFTFSFEAFYLLLDSSGFWQSTILSISIGLVTTSISLILVILFIASWFETPLFTSALRFLSPILSIPHAATAFGLAFLIAPSGFFMRLLSPWVTGFEKPPDLLILNDPLGLSLISGLIVKEVAFILLLTIAALTQSNSTNFAKISGSLGYGKTAGWIKSSFPIIYKQIRLPVLAVLVYATSVVDVSIILGPTTPPPFALKLLSWINEPDLSIRPKASAGALFQFLISLFAILIWFTLEKIVSLIGRYLFVDGKRYQRDHIIRAISATLMFLVIIVAILSLYVLIVWSISGLWQFPNAFPSDFSLTSWIKYFPNLLELVYTSSLIGIVTTLLCAIIVIMCLENEYRSGIRLGNISSFILFLPLLVPQITFLFGLQIILLVLGIDGTILSVIFVHMIFTFPYIYLSLSNQWHALDTHFLNISASLGSSQLRALLIIRLPLLLRPIMVAGVVGFAVSISLYLPTLFVGGGRISTITTEAVALASGGHRQIIAVHALIQMILPLIGFTLAILIPSWFFKNRNQLKITS